MNNCQKIKDLILTDYIDGQLPQDQKKEVSAHLTFCVSCQKFADETAKTLIIPFSEAVPEKVPSHLWENIKSKIQEETPQEAPSFVERFLGAFGYPKFAPILVTVVLLSVVGSWSVHNLQVKQAQDKDQVQYISGLLESEIETSTNNFGTSIEEYFL